VTKAALTYFRERKTCHFIQFSSVGGRIGPPGRGPYSAAKWGVEGSSEVLSREVAPLGIKVTIVEPGGFRTDFAGSDVAADIGCAAGVEFRPHQSRLYLSFVSAPLGGFRADQMTHESN